MSQKKKEMKEHRKAMRKLRANKNNHAQSNCKNEDGETFTIPEGTF